MPAAFSSAAVRRIHSAACFALLLSFQRMLAKPSGESIEYTEFSSIHTSFPTARARAPPLPPSPMMTVRTGTFRADIS